MASFQPIPWIQVSDDAGAPLAGGKVWTYISGTTTNKTTYTDAALITPNTNPIILNARGEAQMALGAGAYSLKLLRADDTLVKTIDGVVDSAAAGDTLIRSDLAAPGGSGLVVTIASGIGAFARTLEAKGGDIVSVFDFMTTAEVADVKARTLTLDVTVNYQKALTAVSLTGGDLYQPTGLAKITARLDSTGSSVRLLLGHDAGISYDTPDFTAIKFTGPKCAIEGGLAGGFIGPAVWDGTNTAPTYAVVIFGGSGSYMRTRLFNIKKYGAWFKDVDDGTVEGCLIEGNYPSASWTGTQVGHVGVLFDPAATATTGNFKLIGNTIKSCVQGCNPANYGSGGILEGFVAAGNIFDGCWNHGIYSNFTSGAVITGNNFHRCQVPVVVSGNKNTVVGNTMYTLTNVAGDERDSCGISVRDGSHNTIVGNTLKGVFTTGNTVCINIQDIVGVSELNDNLVIGNTIEMTAGVGVAIRIVGGTHAVNRNIVSSNIITSPGKVLEGAISIYGLAGSTNLGNKVVDNNITLTSEGQGVYCTNLTAAAIKGNTVEYAWDAGVATTVATVALFGGVNCTVDGNTSIVRPIWGANLTVNGYREFAGVVNNTVRNNINQVDTTKGAVFAILSLVANSGLLIEQAAPGAPNWHARIGSFWRCTDGTPGATLYIKESGTDASGWRALDTILNSAAVVYDPASIAAAAQIATTMTVSGAGLGDFAEASFSLDLQQIDISAYVSAANVVTVVLRNNTAAPIDLASGTLRSRVRKAV